MSFLQKHTIAVAVLAAGLNLGFAAQAQTAAASAPAPGMAASGAAMGKLSGADRTFVAKASAGGMAEVAMGKLAQEKAGSEPVKQFGAKMVADHTKSGDELKQIATSKGVQPAADMDKKHHAMMDKLGKLSGAEFDRAYIKAMVPAHKETAALMTKESKSGKDPELMAFAGKTLPTVQAHLKLAQDLDASMKSGAAGASAPK